MFRDDRLNNDFKSILTGIIIGCCTLVSCVLMFAVCVTGVILLFIYDCMELARMLERISGIVVAERFPGYSEKCSLKKSSK